MHRPIIVSRIYFPGKIKSTCLSFLTTAKEFSESARLIYSHAKNKTPYPEKVKVIYYLIGHSMELAFKSFLHHKEYSIDRLIKIGHDLEKLNRKCCDNGLNILDVKEVKKIKKLNEYYRHKDIGYQKTNFILAHPEHYFKIIEKLYIEIRQILEM